jgi:uncharacterized protein YjiS (DUF1127 family)
MADIDSLKSMQEPLTMQTVFRRHRSCFARWVDAVADRWREHRRYGKLRDLDARSLSDIGIDASEIPSIAAESAGRSPLTRRRIVPRGVCG